MSDRSLPLRIARWFDDRLADLELAPTSTVRLYGIEVIDAESLGAHPGAARSVFITDGDDIEQVLLSAVAGRAFDFDAAAVVEFPWLTVDQAPPRPGQFQRRRRGRLVRVMMFDGSGATVCRCGDLEVVSEQTSSDAAA
jgi:hypothetical protein